MWLKSARGAEKKTSSVCDIPNEIDGLFIYLFVLVILYAINRCRAIYVHIIRFAATNVTMTFRSLRHARFANKLLHRREREREKTAATTTTSQRKSE